MYLRLIILLDLDKHININIVSNHIFPNYFSSGLNLTSANMVILLEADYNPFADLQVRLHQTIAFLDFFPYHFVFSYFCVNFLVTHVRQWTALIALGSYKL